MSNIILMTGVGSYLPKNKFSNQDLTKFIDTSELKYGLPERSYTSFIHASEEAAISRFYGGIHYMMAIDEGVTQGQAVGEYVVKKIQTKVRSSISDNSNKE